MDHIVCMRMRQGGADGTDNGPSVEAGERLLIGAFDHIAEAFAVEHLHRVEGGGLILLEFINLDDVLVRQSAQAFELAPQSLDALAAPLDRLAQDLDGDLVTWGG